MRWVAMHPAADTSILSTGIFQWKKKHFRHVNFRTDNSLNRAAKRSTFYRIIEGLRVNGLFLWKGDFAGSICRWKDILPFFRKIVCHFYADLLQSDTSTKCRQHQIKFTRWMWYILHMSHGSKISGIGEPTKNLRISICAFG